jgi:hypothetical protein
MEVVCEMIRLIAESLFNSGSSDGHITVHWIEPKIMDRQPDLP